MTGLRVAASPLEGGDSILSPEALQFVGDLHRKFDSRRETLLTARTVRRRDVASGASRLDFLPATAGIRGSEWTVAEAPADLRDRRVEITGPTERKVTINALNSGARVWLADLEDANTPHWANVVGGQVNLFEAVRRTITHRTDDKQYLLRPDAPLPTIVMRPRGWHLTERHVLCDGKQVAGALVDFGLYFFHNAAELLARGSGPYFYLPKLESHLEARLWNDVFAFAEERLGLPETVVRATVLIETIPAAFEMDEMLFELRERASGLNAGRWDYLFSLIKELHASGPQFVLPDRNAVTMTAPFMRAYTDLLVHTCHRRGAVAIGGMAAFIPNRRDPALSDAAIVKVRADKEREADAGFDGSWVAHPDLVSVCEEIFDGVLGGKANQVDRLREDVSVTAEQLLDVPSAEGRATLSGLRGNVEVSLRYVESWLRGSGAAAIKNLMEDAATAEIARSQVWQWRNCRMALEDGTIVTDALVSQTLAEAVERVREELGPDAWEASRFVDAAQILAELLFARLLPDFLTVPAYDAID